MSSLREVCLRILREQKTRDGWSEMASLQDFVRAQGVPMAVAVKLEASALALRAATMGHEDEVLLARTYLAEHPEEGPSEYP